MFAPSATLPKLPTGWRLDHFADTLGNSFTRAIDSDGCRWYPVDGAWKMNVPWFRRSPGLHPDACDDLAVVETVTGNRAYPITESGTILIGSRRITSREWDH